MSGGGNIVAYEDVKSATENNEIYIIDVREPAELQNTGVIPNSINIPLNDVSPVFQSMSDDKFQEKYGRSKPNSSTPIIFSCMAGGRATRAYQAVSQLGFNNVKIYSGSWKDWAQHLQ